MLHPTIEWIDEKEVCPLIESTDHFTMVTTQIAIGNIQSSYEAFDIVVDLSCQLPELKHREIKVETVDNKTIYRIGLYDTPEEPLLDLLEIIIPELIEATLKQPGIKILFHCQVGRSRSASFAISYLGQLFKRDYHELVSEIQTKRSIVQPNPGFCLEIQRYLDKKNPPKEKVD